jgi:hypothetical protein
MTFSRPFFLCVIGAASVLALGQGATLLFQGKQGEMKLSGFQPFRATRISKDPERWSLHMEAAGSNPIVGSWSEQKLTIRARVFDGIAERTTRGMELETAKMSGGVTMITDRPSSKAGASQAQTITLTSPSVDFNGATFQADLKGGVTIDQKDPAAQVTLLATGANGSVVLSDPATAARNKPLQSANLTGNARITLNAIRQVTDRTGGTPKKVNRPYQIILTGNRVQFVASKAADEYGTVTVTGNVDVKGDESVLFGQASGIQKLTVTFDAEMQPSSVVADGDPVRTTVTERGGGRR